jgi:hypothetical protein
MRCLGIPCPSSCSTAVRQHPQRLRQPGLVALERGQEALRVPGVPGRLGCRRHEAGDGQLGGRQRGCSRRSRHARARGPLHRAPPCSPAWVRTRGSIRPVRRWLTWWRRNPDAGVAVALTLLYVLARALSPYPSIDGDGHYTWMWARLAGLRSRPRPRQRCADLRRPLAPRGGAHWARPQRVADGPVAAVGSPPPARALDPPRRWWPRGAACRGAWAELSMQGSALAAAGALWLALVLARRHALPRGATALGIAVIGLCSMLPFYAVVAPSYAHAAPRSQVPCSSNAGIVSGEAPRWRGEPCWERC